VGEGAKRTRTVTSSSLGILKGMTVTTRRDRRERERTRQQRRRSGGGSPTPRRSIGQGWIVLGAVAALIALVLAARALGAFDAPAPPVDVNATAFDTTGQTVGTKIEALSAEHIPAGQPGNYNSVPPTSGQHWAAPAAPAPWGIKDTNLPNEVTTHNLEHGGIVIAYNNLSSAELDQLKGTVRALLNGTYRKIILEPYPALTDAKVALTSWGWLLKLPSVDQIQIVQFTRAHYSDPNFAPEANVQ